MHNGRLRRLRLFSGSMCLIARSAWRDDGVKTAAAYGVPRVRRFGWVKLERSRNYVNHVKGGKTRSKRLASFCVGQERDE